METTTSEYWDIDGIPLNSYCWNIKTYGGSRQSLPNLRGENKLVPMRPGRRFVPKIADSKVITMAMWVAGVDPDTGRPSTYDQIIQWNDNWDMLRRMLWTPGKEVALTKRWWRNVSSPELAQATAAGQIAGNIEPTMTGRSRADFAIDFLLADPFFYGNEISVPVPTNMPFTVTNPGDSQAMHEAFTIEFSGDLVNPTLINQTNGVWMKINSLIPVDTNVMVNVGTFNATRSADGTSMAGSMTQGGSRYWMVLEPGNNELLLQATGSGAATITFRPPYVA